MTQTPATELPDMLGETIDNGRLKLVQRLGIGAYGIVYKAVDLYSSIDNPVFFAVKCVKKLPVGEKEAIFQARELKLHKMVDDHPNVLTIHRHFSDRQHVFIVLDYCPAGDLFAAITDNRYFCRNNALIKNVFIQILDGLQHCHNKEVFHRDLKPENILYDPKTCSIRIADFGLATQARTCSDFGLGSPFYMSPESIDKEQKGTYSCRHSDIWALGVILTNLTCGRAPWRFANLEDECYLSYLANSDFLLHSLPISKETNAILKSCFQLHPIARPSIGQIRAAVLKTDTFFLTDAELSKATPIQRAIAQYYATGEFSSPISDQEVATDESGDNDSSIPSVDPEEVYLYAAAPFDSPSSLSPPPKIQVPGDSASVSTSDASSGGSQVLSVSDASSGIEGNLTEPTTFIHSFAPVTRATQISEKPISRSGSLWKRTIRRFKALGI
ncbi:Serine/threonine protein kinase [Favolaschia claudopus]|uniref:non-specific serine/threonine protein kinase n=1 Tax=Favolaschia claudopus TaxID=2862362 RepID=A0AAW0ED29_9AGAR